MPGNETALQLRVQFRGVEPPVWRRVLAPGVMRLDKFYLVRQAAMGWTNSHLHNFTVGNLTYGPEFEDDPDGLLVTVDEKTVTLGQVLRAGKRMLYEYDFGDSWEHDVVVEDRASGKVVLKFAVCLDGQNACPPEDCGGPSGYEALLAALDEPANDEHDSMLEWMGGPFDASGFSLADANAALQRVR